MATVHARIQDANDGSIGYGGLQTSTQIRNPFRLLDRRQRQELARGASGGLLRQIPLEHADEVLGLAERDENGCDRDFLVPPLLDTRREKLDPRSLDVQALQGQLVAGLALELKDDPLCVCWGSS